MAQKRLSGRKDIQCKLKALHTGVNDLTSTLIEYREEYGIPSPPANPSDCADMNERDEFTWHAYTQLQNAKLCIEDVLAKYLSAFFTDEK